MRRTRIRQRVTRRQVIHRSRATLPRGIRRSRATLPRGTHLSKGSLKSKVVSDSWKDVWLLFAAVACLTPASDEESNTGKWIFSDLWDLDSCHLCLCVALQK